MNARQILSKLNNKYVYATLVFVIFFLFIDEYNLIDQHRQHNVLRDKKAQVEFYEEENKKDAEFLERLKTDTALMEQVAREQYKMKRDNEVIYLIETQE
jgi:cell division protein FtsB